MWLRSSVGRAPTSIWEARVQAPSKPEFFSGFFFCNFFNCSLPARINSSQNKYSLDKVSLNALTVNNILRFAVFIDCKDTDAKCPSWALLKQCKSGDRISWMNTNCRKSCGMCKGMTSVVEELRFINFVLRCLW